MTRAPAGLLDRLRGELDPLTAALLDHASAGVLVLDAELRVVRANARLREMVGPAALAEAGLALTLFAPDTRAALGQQLRNQLAESLATASLPCRLTRDGAQDVPVELSVQALHETGPAGRAVGLIVHIADTSQHQRLEAQLAQSQKLQAVGQLAAGIAHDFNNLLTAVVGAAEMIAARADTGSQTRADAAEICGSAERGAALVRQLLAFGRQQALLPQVIRINDAIEAIAGLLRRLLGAHITVELDLAQPTGAACVDPTQLDQVLINLAVNARDAMEQGGTLTLRSGHITLYRPLARGAETIPPGRYVMIEVQDTGRGISAELLPRIFDPFFTTRRDRGGTGLGLSTVHGIIRQSHGFLGVESALGLGTRFRVYLPRCEDIPEASAPPPDPVPCPAEGRPVLLLVDDEDAVRRLAARALSAAGWQVLEAECAEAALRLAATTPIAPSLLVSDVVMPGLDGPALAASLRQTWPGLRVLLMSGYVDERLRTMLLDAGITFLDKPYRLADLVRCAADTTRARKDSNFQPPDS